MPQLYYPGHAENVRQGGRCFLPTRTIRRRLDSLERQRLIPFLGAGASLRPAPSSPLQPPAVRPTSQTVDRVCAECNIQDPQARRFVEIALQFAQLVEQRNALIDDEDPQLAPSSWQLARRLAETLRLEPLRPVGDTLRLLLAEDRSRTDHLEIVKCVGDVMGLSRSVPQLLTVASYFNQQQDREELVHALADRFTRVRQVTPIQEVVAQCADQFVSAKNSSHASGEKADYLIITTNYDRLMELHLTECRVPTCVLRVDRHSRVLVDFMPGTQDFLQLSNDKFAELVRTYKEDDFASAHRRASKFSLADKSHSLAMVYKIHGCPVTDEPLDNVVISDQDYVMFIQKNGANNELIPAYVQQRAMSSGFLFLGYSFADWNVRSLYKQFVQGRLQGKNPATPEADAQPTTDDGEDADYIVMKTYDDSDDYFFQRWRDLSILVTDLDYLAGELTRAQPAVRAS